MNKDKSSHKLVYAAVAAPLLTALLYVISFGYQSGRLSAFGIAEEFMSFNPTQLLIAIKILALYLLLLLATVVLVAENFNLKLKKSPIEQKKLFYQVLYINILAFAIAKTLNSGLTLIFKLVIIVGILTTYLVVVSLTNNYVTKKKRLIRKKSQILGIRYGNSDFQDYLGQSTIFKTGLPVFVSTVLIGLVANLAGSIVTQFNKSYYQVSGLPDYVVVTKSDDKLLLAGFDPKTHKLNEKYLVIPLDEKIDISTNHYIPLELPNENSKHRFQN